MNEPILPTNRLAIVSLAAAILTVLSFCGGVAPIPLTGWFCFPGAIFLGLVALLTGLPALRQIRTRGERGRGMALIGAWLGGLTILATLCAIVLTISALAALSAEIWKQVRPGLFPTPTP
jgi:hypothetical protein